MPNKTQLVTVAMTLAALYIIHNVAVFEPVKKFLNLDQ